MIPRGFFIGTALAVCTSVLSALSASKVLGQLDWIVLAISGLATLSTTLLSQTSSQETTKNHKKRGCNLKITGHSKPLLGNRITGIQQPIQLHRNFPRIAPFERGSHDGFIRVSASLLNGCDRRLG